MRLINLIAAAIAGYATITNGLADTENGVEAIEKRDVAVAAVDQAAAQVAKLRLPRLRLPKGLKGMKFPKLGKGKGKLAKRMADDADDDDEEESELVKRQLFRKRGRRFGRGRRRGRGRGRRRGGRRGKGGKRIVARDEEPPTEVADVAAGATAADVFAADVDEEGSKLVARQLFRFRGRRRRGRGRGRKRGRGGKRGKRGKAGKGGLGGLGGKLGKGRLVARDIEEEAADE